MQFILLSTDEPRLKQIDIAAANQHRSPVPAAA
jgi:hypothetical protein